MMKSFIPTKAVFDAYEKKEEERQQNTLNFTASENVASKYVRSASASVFTNKYSEGRPGKRYYGGQDVVDPMELGVESLAAWLFGAREYHVNVQALSGAAANFVCYFGVIEYLCQVEKAKTGKLPEFHEMIKKSVFLGMKLDHGGHLTQGHSASLTGRVFNFVQYGVNPKTYRVGLDEIRTFTRKYPVKLITIGPSSYSRKLSIFKELADIAQSAGAFFMADIAHTAGLVAGGAQPSPFPYADIVTMTTHKTLRGPRGAIIFVKKSVKFDTGKKNKKGESVYISLADQIDRALFPGLQGGPHDQQTYAIGKALLESLKPKFKKYVRQVIKNAKRLAESLKEKGFEVVSGGTENHLLVLDLRKAGLTGQEAEDRLVEAGIVTNRNAIPFDPAPPWNPSGIRLGTPALTTRGMKEKEMKQIAGLINDTLTKKRPVATIRKEVLKLCKKFPIE